ncbi:MAG: hypothetical protein IAE97_04995 [Chthoniobacterales bacterium]|nr:hypothetical protein [Chthoniobacterales bacterium]
MGMQRWGALLACAVLTGCVSLRDTTVFYTPIAGETYAPLPKNAEVPVMAEPPKWPHKVIGRFAAQSDRGYAFLHKAILYNARLQGADAVILSKVAFDLRRTYNYIPPSWENIPQTSVFYQTVKNNRGEWVTVPQPYTTFVPIFRPARTMVADVQWTDLVAEMIVRKNKPAWSPPSTPP